MVNINAGDWIAVSIGVRELFLCWKNLSFHQNWNMVLRVINSILEESFQANGCNLLSLVNKERKLSSSDLKTRVWHN